MDSSTEEVKDYGSSDDSIFDDAFHSKVSLGLSSSMKQITNIGDATFGNQPTKKEKSHELETSASSYTNPESKRRTIVLLW